MGRRAEDVAALIRARTAGSNLYFSGHPGVPAPGRPDRRGGGPARLRPVGQAAADRRRRARSGVSERVRTASKALARLEELGLAALARAAGRADVDVAVHHLDAAEPAARLAERLAGRLSGSEVVVAELSAVLGVHVGPGTLGVVVAPRFG